MERNFPSNKQIRKDETNEAIWILVILIAIFITVGLVAASLKGCYEAPQVGESSAAVESTQYSHAPSSWRGDSAFWARSRSRIQHYQDSSKVKDK